jgi:hypothetical protein
MGGWAKSVILSMALVTATSAVAGGDPLTATIDTRDADRFAAIFERTGGALGADVLQREYLNGSGRGVDIFTPYRIESAANLAKAVSADKARYAYAIKTCLPLVTSLEGELRATYLAYQGLFPNRTLPAIYIVFGAANSGGTAKADAQVIGLESMCGPGTTPDQFKAAMRNIFAHETSHTFQSEVPEAATDDKLMFYALSEGTPDYLADVVTGVIQSQDREAYGRANEAQLWAQFQKDRALLKGKSWAELDAVPELNAAFHRWFGNAGAAPPGMPSEMGYWVGMQVAGAYVRKASNKRAAIDALLARLDPIAIAAASGYDGKVSSQANR